MKKKAPETNQTICTNKKASFRYEIIEKLECGMMLTGTEVKSLRNKGVSLEEAFVRIERGELWLIGCHISPYEYGHGQNHDPTRKRKLLARGREIHKLEPRVEQKGLTLVPLRVFFNERGIAKVTIALAKGKTTSDKRQSIREREDKREMDRAVRRNR